MMKDLPRTSLIAPLFALFLSAGCDADPRDDDAMGDPGDGGAQTSSQSPEPEAPGQEPAPTSEVGVAGTYELETLSLDVEPPDCRIGEVPTWTWELEDPSQPSWTMTERAKVDGQTRAQPYDCTSNDDGFLCELQTGFDYGQVGQDASVSLEVHYVGTWEDHQTLLADFDVSFSCEGTQCDAVASQWTVAGFPCHNTGEVRGVRQ